MNINEIEKEFNLNENHLCNKDILVDLDSKWTDGDSYQIIIQNNDNGIIRNIEMYKVSKNNLILFLDSFSKQATVLNLDHNNSSSTYSFKENPVILFSYQSGRNQCTVYEENNKLHYSYKKAKTRKKDSVNIFLIYENNEHNKQLLEAKFKEVIKNF